MIGGRKIVEHMVALSFWPLIAGKMKALGQKMTSFSFKGRSNR